MKFLSSEKTANLSLEKKTPVKKDEIYELICKYIIYYTIRLIYNIDILYMILKINFQNHSLIIWIILFEDY